MLSISKAAFFLLSYERSPRLFNTSGGISWIISGDSINKEYNVQKTKVCDWERAYYFMGDRVCARVEGNVLLMEGIVLRRVVFLDYIVSNN